LKCNISYNIAPSKYIYGLLNRLKFIKWLIPSLIISIKDLFLGQWHHALILGEAIKAKVVFLNNNPFLYRQEMRSPNWDTVNIRITDKAGRLIPYFGELDLSITIEREQFNEPQNLARIKDQNPWTADMFYK
jgi:hypothetical protein